jgi:hypothetical protein
MKEINNTPGRDGKVACCRHSRFLDSMHSDLQARRHGVLHLTLTVCVLCLSLVSCSLTTDRSSNLTAPTPIPTSAIPVDDTDDVPSTEVFDRSLLSVERFKMRFDAGYRGPSGNLVKILRGTGQFESRGRESEPLSYLRMHLEGDRDPESSIEIYFTKNMVSARGMGLGDRWIGMPLSRSRSYRISEPQGISNLAMDDPNALLVAMAGMPGMRDAGFYSYPGLSHSSEDLGEGWEVLGESTLDGQAVYRYGYRPSDDEMWKRIMPGVLIDTGIIERFSSELWIGAADGHPRRIHQALAISLGGFLESTQIEINLYPYDFNEPLSLPSDLPPYP